MKVIKLKYLPPKLPFTATIVWWLALDKAQPPQWVWGGMITLTVILWLATIYNIWVSEPCDIDLKGKP